MTFAALTPTLIIGGFAERIKLSGAVLFAALWVTFVYFPVAHMAWDGVGLFFGRGALDFAGGTVVHINAGIAALVGAWAIGPRIRLDAVGSGVADVFATVVKHRLGYDDSLDVFGSHGVAGIVGPIGTGILAAPALGSVSYAEAVTMVGQLWVQAKAVLVTIA